MARAEMKELPAAYWYVVGVGAVLTLARFGEGFLVLRAQQVGLPLAWVPTVLIVMSVVRPRLILPAHYRTAWTDARSWSSGSPP
jgi:hypothetical protein